MIASSIIIFHIRIPYAEAAERRHQDIAGNNRGCGMMGQSALLWSRASGTRARNRYRVCASVQPQGRLQVDIEREPQSPFCAIPDSL